MASQDDGDEPHHVPCNGKSRIRPEILEPKSDSQAGANDVGLSEEEEVRKMIIAFSHENKSSFFDWDSEYGEGFDVIIPELVA